MLSAIPHNMYICAKGFIHKFATYLFDDTFNVTPVQMIFLSEIQELANQYKVSLCGLFSDTAREANVYRYSHMQGEVNAIIELDNGFLAIKPSEHA